MHIMDPNWLSISLYLCPGKLLDRAFSPSMHCNEARQVCVRMSSSEVSVASRMGSNDLRLSLTLNPPPCPQNMAHIFTLALIHPNRLRFRFPCTWLPKKRKYLQRLRKIQIQNMVHIEGHTRSSKSHHYLWNNMYDHRYYNPQSLCQKIFDFKITPTCAKINVAETSFNCFAFL